MKSTPKKEPSTKGKNFSVQIKVDVYKDDNSKVWFALSTLDGRKILSEVILSPNDAITLSNKLKRIAANVNKNKTKGDR